MNEESLEESLRAIDERAPVLFGIEGRPLSVPQSPNRAAELLSDHGEPLYVLRVDGHIVLLEADGATVVPPEANAHCCIGTVPAVAPERLGSDGFRRDHGTRYAYYAGAMANAIHSSAMVIALGRRGILGSYGAGGVPIEGVRRAVDEIADALPDGPFAINLLHNPGQPAWEMDCVEHLLERGVRLVEASAYINLTPAIVLYRAAGLVREEDGRVIAKNRIIAKLSRPEVARRFMEPPPPKLLEKLVRSGRLDAERAELAAGVAMADDITVEGDSGGHTDHGVLSCIFGEIVAIRDEIHERRGYRHLTRVGVAGGLGTPRALSSAFALGADFVVSGSVNQACIEAGTSEAVRALLLGAGSADVTSAPSADMFELGADVQVLKSGSMYGPRARKLYSLYKHHDSLEDIPAAERAELERSVFGKPLEAVWEDTESYLCGIGQTRLLEKARAQPKRRMALTFQWYLGQSSKWAKSGLEQRRADYQIWCGPAMGACNAWLKGTALQSERPVADLAELLMHGAASLSRLSSLEKLGVAIPPRLAETLSRRSGRARTGTDAGDAIEAAPVGANAGTRGQSREITPTPGEHTMNAQGATGKKLALIKSKEYYKKTWEMLPGGAHYNFGDPERSLIIPFNRGEGSRVWDLDGNEHLDLFCKFGALIVGHKHAKYDQRLLDYMRKVTSVDTCDLELEVCETLTRHIPCAEMVRFSLSGTEAVQNALRLARAYTGKNRFIRFHGHYHGNADNIIGGRRRQDLSWPTPELFRGDLMDTAGRARGCLEEQSFMLPWNDLGAVERTVSGYAGELCAVLMEPICMNGGGILPKDGYLQGVKDICEANNMVLIFDEIITGVRLGLGGAQDIVGVTPHLATFAKALGGGSMPISMIAGQKDLMSLYTKGKVIHAGTFNGYPLGLAAVQATYDIIEEDPGCYQRMGDTMAKICRVFTDAARQVGLPMIVQGMPTALVYHSQQHLVDRSEGYTDRTKFCDIIIREIAKRYGLQFSPLSRLYPNIQIGDDDVEFFRERIYDTMENARKIIDITFQEEVA